MDANGSPPRRSQRRRPQPSSEPAAAPRQTIQRRTLREQPSVVATSSSPLQPSEQRHEDVAEDVAEDDLCPICRLLLYRPVTTRCNHTLCESCMAHWADVSVTSQMTIVDVDEEPVAFDAVSGLEARCPMCRTQTSASMHQQRADALAAMYPITWAERGVEEEDEQDLGGGGSIQTLTVYVGNRHHVVEAEDANSHEWTFFVKPSRTDIIEEVQIQLHPTFRPNRVIRQRAPYEICRLGWGYFTIVAYVILKAGYTWVSEDAQDSPDGAAKGMLPLEWTLDFGGFGGKGSMGRCKLKVKNDREWQDVSSEEERDNRELLRTNRSYDSDGRYEPQGEQ